MTISNEGIIAFGAMIGSKDLILKVLGPTADYIGLELKDWTEKRVENIKSIFDKTEKRMNENPKENYNTAISPYLLKSILEYGSFTEDDLIQEYLAGLLFSSRKGIEKDNRASVLSILIQNMSIYEIRLHYLVYSILRKIYLGVIENIGIRDIRRALQTYISYNYVMDNIVNTIEERNNFDGIVESSIYGLLRHDLIEEDLVFGRPEHIAKVCKSKIVNEPGIVIQPSILGIELFLWISGVGSKTHSKYYLDKDIEIPDLIDISDNKNGFFRYPE